MSDLFGWEDPKKVAPSVSNGQKIILKEKGFSITPPAGWEVYKDIPNTTLLLRTPYQKDLGGFQRSIQVMSFKGIRYMDEVTAREYENLLLKKFKDVAANIKNYRVRNHVKLELANKTPAFLFYADYQADQLELMQAAVLVSSGKRHFLTIYTDLAKNIEAENTSPEFQEAWKSLLSIEVDSVPSTRFHTPTMIGIGIIGLIGIIFLLAITRYSFSTVKYRKHSRNLDSDLITKDAWIAEEGEGSGWDLPGKSKHSKSTHGGNDDDDDLAV